MAKISKPTANPLAAAVLTVFFSLGHILVNGQQRKFLVSLIGIFGLAVAISVVVSIAWQTNAGLGRLLNLANIVPLILGIFSIIDAYKTAEKLAAGKEIEENEYSFELWYKIVKNADKTATFVA